MRKAYDRLVVRPKVVRQKSKMPWHAMALPKWLHSAAVEKRQVVAELHKAELYRRKVVNKWPFRLAEKKQSPKCRVLL